jgi:hypothetical protein
MSGARIPGIPETKKGDPDSFLTVRYGTRAPRRKTMLPNMLLFSASLTPRGLRTARPEAQA